MINEIILYRPNELTEHIEVMINEETVWLNRQQLAILFDRDVKTIGKHITNVVTEELKGLSVVAKFATTAFFESSPSKKTLFICLPIVLISLWKTIAN